MRVLLSLQCFAFVLALLPAMSLAGSAVIATGGQPGYANVSYQDGLVHVNPQNERGALLLRDGQLYLVVQGKVIKADTMLEQLGVLDGVILQGLVDAERLRFVSLRPTGAGAQVAGLQGNVYQLSFEQADGRVGQTDVVLSPDPRAREMTAAILAIVQASGRFDQAELARLQSSLQGKGVLQVGGDVRVVRFGPEPDLAQFDLPGPPQSLSQLLGGITHDILRKNWRPRMQTPDGAE